MAKSTTRKPPAPSKTEAALTTRENLSALIGAARKILRKDKGLNGDVDRLPLLTWVMFLKFLDDLETVHEDEAELDGKPYRPIIEPPYRGATGPRGKTAFPATNCSLSSTRKRPSARMAASARACSPTCAAWPGKAKKAASAK